MSATHIEIYALLRELVGCTCAEWEPDCVRYRDAGPSTLHLRRHRNPDAVAVSQPPLTEIAPLRAQEAPGRNVEGSPMSPGGHA